MKKLIVGSIFLLVFLGYNSSAQESKFKALFLNKFTQYIDWPSDGQKQVIGVFGQSKVYDELSELAKTNDHFEVVQIFAVEDSDKCDLVYVPEYMKFFTPKLKEQIGDKSILVISDVKAQAGSSADIGFYVENQRLLFAIDTESIRSKKMIPSQRIIILGTRA